MACPGASRTNTKDFVDELDNPGNQAAFVNALANAAPAPLLVKVRDRDDNNGAGGSTPLDGIADEIDIETP